MGLVERRKYTFYLYTYRRAWSTEKKKKTKQSYANTEK